GKCWHRPCLGCREFAASFGPVGEKTPWFSGLSDQPREFGAGADRPIDRSEPLGLMFYDYFDVKAPNPDQPALARWFPAALDQGVLKIDRSQVMAPLKEI